MFRDVAFNLALAFSAIWHLLWIHAVDIVMTPNIQTSIYQEIDFLGPILEKTAFDLMVEEGGQQAETSYRGKTLFLDDVYLKPKGPERKVLEEFISDKLLDRFTFSLRDYVKDTKEVPLYFAEDIRITYAKTVRKEFSDWSGNKKVSIVEGPAGGREIIFKPEPPRFPRGLYDDALEYAVKLKFSISGNGIVHDVEPITSSGYPEIDLEAIRFLRHWRFSPSSLVEKDKPSWGIVVIKIGTE